MSRVMRVKAEVYVDVDLDAYEREYYVTVGDYLSTKNDIRADVRRDVEDATRIYFQHNTHIFNVRQS